MHIFLTGASGWVGSAVMRQLIAAGHDVTGMARSDASATKIETAGGAVHRGDLTDTESLSSGARAADAVIHCGYNHDFSDIAGAAALDRQVISVLGDALAGSDKPLLVTSGTAGMSEDETTETAQTRIHPRPSEPAALAQVERGVRAMVVRLPFSVHGDGDHGFVPAFVGFARQNGTSYYVGDGMNRWPAVHVEDAAATYVLALEKGVAGGRYNAVGDEGIPFRDIAAMIGEKLGLPVASVTPEQASEKLGFLGQFAGIDLPANSILTQERLGWTPTHRGLIEDLRDGTYFG